MNARNPETTTALFALTSQQSPTPRARRGGWSWGPVEGAKLRVLSLGAGIQSTTLALMAAQGEIGPMPDCAIFADTGDESTPTLETVAWLSSGNVLPFPIHRVSAGRKISDDIRLRATEGPGGSRRFASAPFFTGNGGRGRRQCTREFKIEPIEKEQRRLAGYLPRQIMPKGTVEVWIGISLDEVVRAGAAFARWAVHRHPLLEKRMTRQDCVAWLRRHDYPVPEKSACIFCPNRTDFEWRRLKERDPASFAAAVEIDALCRQAPGMRHQEFVHASRRPLAEIDFSSAEDRGQGMLDICEAGCGL
ncbi:hypothetical protein [Methylosinus sp. LW4]|uniref:hypothetical protein n=1 Tax=Methylosinus sp. LW4 TaxID=136993 RepID=UPI000475AFE3|nr:hypothetical protein [Methylosinus sp. LW4]